MPPSEKHGGLWGTEHADSRGTVVFESYLESEDVLAIVFQRQDGLFEAVLFRKSHDVQWRLPWWSEDRPTTLFDSKEDAIQHVTKLARKA